MGTSTEEGLTTREYKEYWESFKTMDEVMQGVGGVDDFHVIGCCQKRFLLENGLEPHHKLLDLACGCGRLAVHLKGFLDEGNYYGCDISKYMIHYARILTDDWGFFVTIDGINLPFDDAQFDVIAAFSVFTHVDEAVMTCLLKESFRTLKTEGKMFLTIHVEEGKRGEGPIVKKTWDKTLFEQVCVSIGFAVKHTGDTKVGQYMIELTKP